MKRTSLLLASVASLMPSQLAPLLAEATPSAESPAFQPPSTPLVLTRTLWRSLRDGQEIMVRRSYEVRFSRNREGFLLDGRLIDTAVAAPAPLAMLAEIERRRPDTGMFPLHLDAQGRIIGQPERTISGAAHSGAVEHTRMILARSALQTEARKEAEQLAQSILHSAVGATAWPSDLFSPAARSRREKRSLALGNGQQGEIEVAVEVRGAGEGGLPQVVERRIATEVDGSARTSREVWTLAPAEPGV